MKEYPTSCWQGYLNSLKKSLDRPLTTCEIKLAMNRYIHSVTVEETLEEIEDDIQTKR